MLRTRFGRPVALLLCVSACRQVLGIDALSGQLDAAPSADALAGDNDGSGGSHHRDGSPREASPDVAASDASDGSCTLGTECQNTWVCDPTTRRCVSGECTDDSDSCGTDQTCVLQYHETVFGACYTACLPFASGACPAGDVCIPVATDGSAGACFPTGTTKIGDPCVVSDVQSACGQGAQCFEQTSTSGWKCAPLCDYWGGLVDCTAPTLCGPQYGCLEPGMGDSAAIGSPCSVGAELLQVCGSDGIRFAGVCVEQATSDAGKTLECVQACRTDTTPMNADCPAGHVCAVFSGLPVHIGVCE
jgi:hypothetical protein